MNFQVLLESYMIQYGRKTEALFHALKDDITGGRLAAGTRLPSTREMAGRYGLSRGTVNVVYDRLGSEGYVSSNAGSGTYVVFRHPEQKAAGDMKKSDHPVRDLPHISSWAKRIDELPPLRAKRIEMRNDDREPTEFLLGKVDLHSFPAKEWNRLMFEQVRSLHGFQLKDAFESGGHPALLESITFHLRRSRGLNVDPDEIVIVNGSQQAIALLAQLLMNPGDAAFVEDPHYLGIRRAILAAGGLIHPCPVDRHGIVFEPSGEKARLLFITSGRQFPTGALLSMERRQKLLEWAERNDAVIIEDDYDSEFRYKGRPIEPLKALDRAGRVVYIGTFSRTMLQDIRLGYAVLPKPLALLFRKAKQLYDPHPTSLIEQRALALFMSSGMYDRHLRRMSRIYKKRAEWMSMQLHDRLASLFDIHESVSGLHLYAEWKQSPERLDRYKVICDSLKVRFADTRSCHYAGGVQSVCFGFSHLDEGLITEGIDRMAEAALLL